MTNSEITTLNPEDVEAESALSEVPEEFLVRDDDSVNWVIRKILASRAYARQCSEWCEREQARAKREEEFFFFRFGQQLFTYARQKIAASGGRRKSFSLPAGTVGFRSEPAKLVVDDESAVIAWAKRNNPSLVSTIEKISKSALNDHLEQTGELPSAGAHIEPAREKFYLK